MSGFMGALKRTLEGTPLEPVSRAVWKRVRPRRRPTRAEILNGEYDRLTYEIIRRVVPADGRCVDVGCHVGKVLDMIVEVAPQGIHHAFEPLPDFAAHLRERFLTVSIHELALSDRTGTATFQHVVDRPAYSGLHRRPYPHEVEVQQIEVRLARLDDVLEPDYRIDFLKIDVEGGELDVLRGARRHVMESKPVVVFEWGDSAAAPYEASKRDVHRFLASCGLSISHLHAFIEGGASLSEDDFVTTTGFMFVAHPLTR